MIRTNKGNKKAVNVFSSKEFGSSAWPRERPQGAQHLPIILADNGIGAPHTLGLRNAGLCKESVTSFALRKTADLPICNPFVNSLSP